MGKYQTSASDSQPPLCLFSFFGQTGRAEKAETETETETVTVTDGHPPSKNLVSDKEVLPGSGGCPQREEEEEVVEHETLRWLPANELHHRLAWIFFGLAIVLLLFWVWVSVWGLHKPKSQDNSRQDKTLTKKALGLGRGGSLVGNHPPKKLEIMSSSRERVARAGRGHPIGSIPERICDHSRKPCHQTAGRAAPKTGHSVLSE